MHALYVVTSPPPTFFTFQATVDQLGADLVNVVGDVVVAASAIAYAGELVQPCMSWEIRTEHHGVIRQGRWRAG
jgi:hypothetical protein